MSCLKSWSLAFFIMDHPTLISFLLLTQAYTRWYIRLLYYIPVFDSKWLTTYFSCRTCNTTWEDMKSFISEVWESCQFGLDKRRQPLLGGHSSCPVQRFLGIRWCFSHGSVLCLEIWESASLVGMGGDILCSESIPSVHFNPLHFGENRGFSQINLLIL